MRPLSRIIAIGVSAAMVTVGFSGTALAKYRKGPKAKNIIFMVPDGQGLSNVTAARIFKNGPDGPPLYQETLPTIGYQRTHAANSTVTDSAAAASAWAIGEKVNNGEISCHSGEDGECIDKVKTILEIAAKKGKATGLVATSQISHATPAAFGAHTISRYCGAEIARQYIEDTNVDVILGGGVYKTKDYCDVYPESFTAVWDSVADDYDKEKAYDYITGLAAAKDYVYVSDEDGMEAAVSDGSKKILGMFEQAGRGKGKTPEMFRLKGLEDYEHPGEPTLAEMTAAALDVLEEDRDGLFLVVEGSQIDWQDHGNNVAGQIAESLGFDAAVKVVLDWIDEKRSRKRSTLLIIAADHDTGGFAINGPYGTLSEPADLNEVERVVDEEYEAMVNYNEEGNPEPVIEAGWTSGGHTAVDVIVYSQGPGSRMLGRAMDNTDLFYVMKRMMR